MLKGKKLKLPDKARRVFPDRLGSLVAGFDEKAEELEGSSSLSDSVFESGEELETIHSNGYDSGADDFGEEEEKKVEQVDPDPIRVRQNRPEKDVVVKSEKVMAAIIAADEKRSDLEYEVNQQEVNLEKLQRIASLGLSDEGGLRATTWKLLLGYLPPSRDLWEKELTENRQKYAKLKEELLLSPSEVARKKGSDLSSYDPPAESAIDGRGPLKRLEISEEDHPLSLGKSSVWHQYFQNTEIAEQIDRDLPRTHPDLKFFSGESSFSRKHRESLRNILLLFAKLNPAIRYVQGMNEVLAPLYYVFSTDPNEQNAANAEADSFSCFVRLLSDSVDHFCEQLDNNAVGILATLSRLSDLLKANDEELWRHLECTTQVKPQYYGFRWITLLLTQEFNFQSIMRIWDSLLANPFGVQDMLLKICCAMLLCMKSRLMSGDFVANLKLLQHYPEINIEHLLQFHVSGNESVSVDKSEAYERWEQQDSFVVLMITSTLSVDALTLVIGCETSLKVWSTLKQHCAPTSEFHISQLKSTMQTIRKGSETIDKYLLRFKSVRDDLAAAGFNMSDQDVMHYILAGLPVEYGPTRQLIWSKKEISMDEMRCLLLSGELEIKLKEYSSPLPSLADLYAAHNYTCRRNSYLHGAAQSGVFTEASTLVKGTNKLQNSFASSDGDHKLKFVSSCNKDLQSSMPFGNAKTSDISFIAPLNCDFLSNSGLVTSATKSALVESNSTGRARSFSSMTSEYYGSTTAYESSDTDAEKFNPQENGSMQVHTSQANLHSPLGNGNSIQGDQGNTRMKRDIKSEISSTSASESSTIKNEARNQYPCPLSFFSRPQALSATMSSNSKSHSKITRPVSDASRSQPSQIKPLQLVSASSLSSPIHSALQQSFTILGALPTSNNKLHSNTKERSPKVCRQACETKNLRKSHPLIPPG